MDLPFLQVEPTTRCNFTCGFCVGRHLPQRDLELATFRRLIESVDRLRELQLQGEGEPLLHPDFFEMVALAKRRHPDCRVSTITNGSLLTAENTARLLDAGLDRVMVSFESAEPTDFERIRGGSLARVERGVGELQREKRRRGEPAPVVGMAIEPCGEDATSAELKAENARLRRELKRAQMERDIPNKATAAPYPIESARRSRHEARLDPRTCRLA